MILTVFERLVLLETLPTQGDFLTIRTVRELREQLAFDNDAEEIGLGQKETEGGKMHYTWERDTPKRFDITPKALAVIVDSLHSLNANKKLEERHLTLYEKFMED